MIAANSKETLGTLDVRSVLPASLARGLGCKGSPGHLSTLGKNAMSQSVRLLVLLSYIILGHPVL